MPAARPDRARRPRGRLSRRLRRTWRRLVREGTTPGRLGVAIAVGVVVGFTPFYGLHLALCLLVAELLRLNKVAVYAAANVSIPPLAPLIGYASVQVGSRLLQHRWHAGTLSDFRSEPVLSAAGRFFTQWLVGGLVLGSALGTVAGLMAHALVSRRPEFLRTRRRARQRIARALRRTTARFAGQPPHLRHYARWKQVLDPCHLAILTFVPPGARVVDLGTGQGLIPLAVAELGEGRTASGIDRDGPKIEAGRAAARGLQAVRLETGDVASYEIPDCDVVVLADVLHYCEPEQRRSLLARAAAALVPGGRLLVRETDADSRSGARTRWIERLAMRCGWNTREHAPRFVGREALRAELAELGLRVHSAPLSGCLQPGNVLHVAVKPTRQPGLRPAHRQGVASGSA